MEEAVVNYFEMAKSFATMDLLHFTDRYSFDDALDAAAVKTLTGLHVSMVRAGLINSDVSGASGHKRNG